MSELLSLLKEFDIAKLLPDMTTFFGRLTFFMRLVLLVGPILMVILGLIYFFIPPKEANHALGYRSRWSMSSVAVWKYAQWLAGIVHMGLGGALTIAMIIVAVTLGNKEPMGMVTTALICVIVQVVLVMVAWIVIEILLRCYYDAHGNRKRFISPRTPKSKPPKAQAPKKPKKNKNSGA